MARVEIIIDKAGTKVILPAKPQLPPPAPCRRDDGSLLGEEIKYSKDAVNMIAIVSASIGFLVGVACVVVLLYMN